MIRIAVEGLGAVGGRVVRQLVATDEVVEVWVDDPRADLVSETVAALPDRVRPVVSGGSPDAVVLCGPVGTHGQRLDALLGATPLVVSVADGLSEVRDLLGRDDDARRGGTTVVVGAGASPGLSCLLAASMVRSFDAVDEIHVATTGTGGPACARRHHDALAGRGLDWRDGGWLLRGAGSGRELCWFPDPIGPRDCYRAELSEPVTLHAAFPEVARVTARLAATRRDRLTSALPMLRPPHPEGTDGAVRVEVRGRRRGARAVEVLGTSGRPAVLAAAVASAVAVVGTARGLGVGAGCHPVGVDPGAVLADVVARGVRISRFEGGGG